jgi:hypothetical protein
MLKATQKEENKMERQKENPKIWRKTNVSINKYAVRNFDA